MNTNVKKIKSGLSKTATDAKERADRQIEKKLKKLEVKPSKIKSEKIDKPKTPKFKTTKRVTTTQITDILDSDSDSGGALKLSKSLQNQLVIKGSYHGGAVVSTPPPSNIDSYWIYPIPSELQGLPTYLLQHPNKYSGSKSQIMLYSSFENFTDTDFYANNKIKIIKISPPPQFARSSSSDAWGDHVAFKYGQKLRIIFTQGNISGIGSVGVDNNYNSYYIDCADIDEYVNILSQIYKDRHTIQPVEAASILRIARNAKDAQDRYVNDTGNYNRGMSDQADADQKQADAQAQAQAQASDNSSDVWGTLSTIGEIALAVL